MGAISTAVNWYLERDYSVTDILERTERRFGKSNNRWVNKEVGEQIAARAYADKVNTMSGSAKLSQLRPPGSGGATGNLRMTFTAKFSEPGREKGGRWRNVSFTMDSFRVGTLTDLRQRAKEMVKDWVIKNYSVSTDKVPGSVRAIEFESFSTF